MARTQSRKELRQGRILAALEANPSRRVNQLAEELDVSTETIRRDLSELDQIGRLSRTYGGAVSAGNRFEPALNERLGLFVAERRAIARAAVARYEGAETLVLGGGATMLTFARALRETRHRITVITPAYPIAVELGPNPLIEVMLLPGTFEPQERMVCGPETIRALERYRAEVAIIGASGLDPSGVSEAMLRAGEVYAAMLAHANHGVILADHSKFGKRALVRLRGWSGALTLITDEQPPDTLAAAIRDGRSDCVVAAAE
ncbi:DeoR/GlpR family DNA-binding transcription regulator [Albidovulum sp.]|uniref:DeoR/GlpR family DNA-binding transcription regulator n=1 Tax=Albidovulum sp. TaxID=1872424 RepID=UPI0039B9483E